MRVNIEEEEEEEEARERERQYLKTRIGSGPRSAATDTGTALEWCECTLGAPLWCECTLGAGDGARMGSPPCVTGSSSSSGIGESSCAAGWAAQQMRVGRERGSGKSTQWWWVCGADGETGRRVGRGNVHVVKTHRDDQAVRQDGVS